MNSMISAAPPRGHFHRSKIFAPLILLYTSALNGFKDIVEHGLAEKARKETGRSDGEIIKAIIAAGGKVFSGGQYLRGPYVKLFPDLNLDSVAGQSIQIQTEVISSEVAENPFYVLPHLLASAAGSLLIASHEMAKAKGYTTHDPIWEFLRHCRNAAAHGNKFHFTSKEPIRPAEWRNLKIEQSLQGHPLFNESTNSISGALFLKPGDPIHLLWDIEQAYPDLWIN